MSGAVIGALRAVPSFESAAFEKGLDAASKQLAAFDKRMSKMGAGFAKAGAAVSVAGTAISLALRGSINSADDMSKAAQKFGIPIETLSALSHAADLSDVSMGTLGTSVGKLSKLMAAAKGGNKAAAAAFEKIGVAVTDASGAMRPTEDVLFDISDVLSKMPDGAEKTALAMTLLGRSGAEMIPMLNGGGQALRDMMAEAAAMGLVISAETGKAAEDFNDNLTRLWSTLKGLSVQIAAALLPTLQRLSEAALDVARWFQNLSPATQEWMAVAAALVVALGPVLVGFGLVVGSLGKIAGAFRALSLLLLANPWAIAAAAAVAAVVLIYQNWEPIKAWFAALWEDVKAKAQAALDAIKTGWADIGAWFAGILDTVKQAFIDGWENIKAVVAGWVEDFKQFGRDIIEGLRLGIEEKWNAVIAALTEKAEAIKSTFAGLLGLHSPSRIFRQFGAWIMQGLGIGITENLPVVTDAMTGVADAISGTGTSLSSGLQEFGGAIKDVFKGIVDGSLDAKDAVAQLVSKLADMATDKLFDTISKAFSGLFSGGIGGGLGKLVGAAADGAVVSRGRMSAFADGGIVGGPTAFGMRNGVGLMGEAGPEAIMPLTRIGGKLGVQALGAGAAPTVNVNPQIINVLDPSIVGEYMASRRGEQQILNLMRRSGVAVNG